MTTIGPNIPRAPHESFPNSPLKAMLGQIRFHKLPTVTDAGPLASFHARVRGDFPLFDEEHQVTLAVTSGQTPSTDTVTAYRFSTREGDWSAVIGADVLTLEAGDSSRYSSYKEFIRLFEVVWTAFVETFEPVGVVRQGLRYVDHVEGDFSPVEWERLINPVLLGVITDPALAQGLVRAMSELTFRRDDGNLMIRHGITTAGPEDVPGYLLDFDYVNAVEVAPTPSLVVERFDRFHATLYDAFYWSVTDEARKEFRDAGR